MSDSANRAVEILQMHIGKEAPPGEWYLIDQAQINAFADATLDHNFIHVDSDLSRERSPYKTTIAHGFLTLSLLPYLLKQIPPPDPNPFEHVAVAINYGLNRVRFVSPVKVDSRIRARRKLLSVELKGSNAVQVVYAVTVDIEGEQRPACVAECLSHLIYK